MSRNENIDRLMEMMENPQAYSEEEIREIVEADEETREAYRLMVAAKRNYAARKAGEVNVGEAWERFEERMGERRERGERRGSMSAGRSDEMSVGRSGERPMWMRVAASVAAIGLISGLAVAAVHYAGPMMWGEGSEGREGRGESGEATVVSRVEVAAKDSVPTEEATVVYDNVPLEEMMGEISRHYGVEVTYGREEVRGLRFHFVWKREQGIEKVVENLNHFESVRVKVDGSHITVE